MTYLRRTTVDFWGLSDAPLASGECVSVSSGVFVAPYRADDALGEMLYSSAANRPGGVAVDADPQGERDVLRAACRGRARHPSTPPVVEADSVSDPQREQGLRPYRWTLTDEENQRATLRRPP